MGFQKKNVQQTIDIAFEVETIDERVGTVERVAVQHKFRRPTIKEREYYRQLAHSFKNGKSQIKLTKANLFLWNECVISVSGYDDLPVGDFKSYFQDDIGMEHADASVRIMLDKITENESELEKNFD